MKFTVDREELSRSLQILVRSLPDSTPAAILNDFLVKADQGEALDGLLTLTGTKSEYATTMSMVAMVEDPGSITLPGKLLSELVSVSSGKTVVIRQEENKVKLECGASKFTLSTQQAAEYPVWKPDVDVFCLAVSNELKTMIRQALTAVQGEKEATNPTHTGVLFDVKEGILTLVSTDSSRMSLGKANLEEVSGDASVVVPTPTLEQALRLFDGNESTILEIGKASVAFSFGRQGQDRLLISRTIEGGFPEIWKKLPAIQFDQQSKVEAKGLQAAVKVAAVIARRSPKINAVDLETVNGELFIRSGESEEKAEVSAGIYEGDPFAVRFNCDHLLDAIETIRMEQGQDTVFFSNKKGVATYILHGSTTYRHALAILRRVDADTE